MTQVMLAAEVQLDRSSLAKIETGTRRVTALELARIAIALDARIEWFLTDPPPSVVSRRSRHRLGEVDSAIELQLDRIARNIEFVIREARDFPLAAIEPLERPSSRDGAEQAALEARRLMGLDDEQPLLELSREAAAVGLLAFSLDVDGIDGASMLLERGGVAVVNGQMRVGQRRLTLAHELGHYLMADEFAVDWRVGSFDDPAAWETRMDQFARALLLPRTGLTAQWRELRAAGELRTTVVRLASTFRVDMSTLARRLVDIDLVTEAEAAEIRRVRTTRADIVELELVPRHELEPPELASPYVKAVLQLYRDEIVSADRALDLLLDTWSESDLPPLPPVPKEAIWSLM